MRWLLLATMLGCGGNNAAPPKPIVPQDAATPRVQNLIPEPQPRSFDDHRPQPTGKVGHPIDVILRSSPSGADANVDGVPLGTTPTYWNGTADGREHEFTFVLPGHAVARYRFVPITSGVVHARLEPISEETSDAGVAAAVDPTPPGIPTMVVPDAAPIAPPPTVITPDAAELQGYPGIGPSP